MLSIFLPKIPLPPPDWNCIPITLLIGMRLFEKKKKKNKHSDIPFSFAPQKQIIQHCLFKLYELFFNRVDCFCIFFEFILTLQNKTEVEDSNPIPTPRRWPSALKMPTIRTLPDHWLVTEMQIFLLQENNLYFNSQARNLSSIENLHTR